jgi:hypothetical protein
VHTLGEGWRIGTQPVRGHPVSYETHSPDQVEDEALQGTQVGSAEQVDHRVHPSDYFLLVWLACMGDTPPK